MRRFLLWFAVAVLCFVVALVLAERFAHLVSWLSPYSFSNGLGFWYGLKFILELLYYFAGICALALIFYSVSDHYFNKERVTLAELRAAKEFAFSACGKLSEDMREYADEFTVEKSQHYSGIFGGDNAGMKLDVGNRIVVIANRLDLFALAVDSKLAHEEAAKTYAKELFVKCAGWVIPLLELRYGSEAEVELRYSCLKKLHESWV